MAADVHPFVEHSNDIDTIDGAKEEPQVPAGRMNAKSIVDFVVVPAKVGILRKGVKGLREFA